MGSLSGLSQLCAAAQKRDGCVCLRAREDEATTVASLGSGVATDDKTESEKDEKGEKKR